PAVPGPAPVSRPAAVPARRAAPQAQVQSQAQRRSGAQPQAQSQSLRQSSPRSGAQSLPPTQAQAQSQSRSEVRSPAGGQPRAEGRVARKAAPGAVRAGLGRRALARFVDTVLLAAVVCAVAVPVVSATDAYLQRKLDQARTVSHLTGRGVQVWLVDGTVIGRAALLLGTVLLAGLLLEVVPTARAGRTLGKRLAGVRVAAVGSHRAPGFGRSLVRWLLGQLLVLTVIGIPALVSWPDRVGRSRVLRG
ncbi:RDD family protein, partial [Kitasatospora sp. NPDC058965]|uniref:RDD family protein n=1 Tax=Kitasatospora sp. NPDC058965 TaxID=3346682 RepID=UPI0036941F50